MSGPCGGVSGGGSVGWPGLLGSTGVCGGDSGIGGSCCISWALLEELQRGGRRRVARAAILAIGGASRAARAWRNW